MRKEKTSLDLYLDKETARRVSEELFCADTTVHTKSGRERVRYIKCFTNKHANQLLVDHPDQEAIEQMRQVIDWKLTPRQRVALSTLLLEENQ